MSEKKNFKEVELTEQELQELNEVDELEEEPEDHEDEGNDIPETETPKEGKLKKFGKAVLRGVKWAAPKIGLFAAGYATKMAIGKFMKQPAVIDGAAKEVPSIPEIPVSTETIDLGSGVTAEVGNI